MACACRGRPRVASTKGRQGRCPRRDASKSGARAPEHVLQESIATRQCVWRGACGRGRAGGDGPPLPMAHWTAESQVRSSSDCSDTWTINEL